MKLKRTLFFAGSALGGIMLGYILEPSLRSITVASDPAPSSDLASKSKQETEEKDDTSKKKGTKKTVDIDSLLAGGGSGDEEDIDVDIDTDTDDVDIADVDDDGEIKKLRSFVRTAGKKAQPAIEESYTGDLSASAWSNPKALKARLETAIRSQIRSDDGAELEVFIKKPENRLMLAQWQMLHNGDIDALSKLMRSDDAARILEPLLNDLPWMAGFVFDGELERTDVALGILYHLRKVDPNMDMIEMTEQDDSAHPAPTIKRRIAGAIAAEFARQSWYGAGKELSAEEVRIMKRDGIPMPRTAGGRKGKEDVYQLARERYQFFAESAEKRLLNSDFFVLPNWQLRFVCGWKGNSPHGTPETMRWLRDNNAVPISSLMGVSGQVAYLPTNIFGDSIHGPFYYQPFEHLYPENRNKMVRDIGAVCGGISHFCASTANANGIPAITMGEPGHCAFAIYHDKTWHAGYSLSKERSPHWPIWGKSSWSRLQAYADMYEDGEVTRTAQLLATLGNLLSVKAKANPRLALSVYEYAITTQPLFQPVWEAYVQTASTTLHRNPAAWMAVNTFLCEALAPKSPESCANYLRDTIYPTMLTAFRQADMKIKAYNTFFANLDKQEESIWDMDGLLDMQYAPLPKGPARMKYFRTVVDTACEKPQFSLMITWALRTAFHDSKPVYNDLIEYVESRRETSKDVVTIDAAIIRAMEEVGDRERFAQYSAPYLKEKTTLPTFVQPDGELITEGVLVKLSDYHPDDKKSVVYHASALTENGGAIKSLGGKHQTVTLELERAKRIGGIVIVPNGGFGSYLQWHIDISRDGKTWERLIELPDSYDKPVLRVILNRNIPSAKYIRIDSGKDQNKGIDFKALLIYDNSKSK